MLSIVEILLLLVIIALLVQTTKFRFQDLRSSRARLILDSSGLIDGRLLAIVRAHFLSDELIIPQFILNELQLLADGQDAHKRERARFGLDVAHELQELGHNTVVIDRTPLTGITTTDDKLIALSKKLHARLYTTDYNLGKVAAVEAVNVLNVNELAQELRPVSLPGETLLLKVVQKGSTADQGVGYLEDGTMVVIDGAARDIGRQVEVRVDRMHQTTAGKMVFAHVLETRKRQPATPKVKAESTSDKLRRRMRH